jgi:hypothetical protein
MKPREKTLFENESYRTQKLLLRGSFKENRKIYNFEEEQELAL